MVWTESKDKLLIKLFEDKLTRREIAESLNVSKDAVSSRMNALGYKNPFKTRASHVYISRNNGQEDFPTKHGTSYTEQEIDSIKELYLKGNSFEAIAQSTGRSVKGIRSLLRRLSLTESPDRI